MILRLQIRHDRQYLLGKQNAPSQCAYGRSIPAPELICVRESFCVVIVQELIP